ncbi:hypothetical protein [Legionella pneumophila]|uniref:Uncharacterized protein n=1 Tax=Legionella pneumophila subsp. pascullei TaxID=91890 RepID=A0AAX2IT50_LEGPN|nr:hypothetical protein [Legionella pneumophila]AMP88245.1 hypothetical protein AXF35_00400 [Legionella pneumophila subsp. pascullei]AMP91154.1 hypothetical protein AXF36_00400 [Legionella pneumophila subsp. pascullei]AMP94141.1 hypothetical protein AXF37_00400 [Legionella pneumophila subsp. pascullei]SQG88914.1 Uncharacterised protein [Legionella pneumophila subsp. pascullei]VEH03964.1 Uncharacterised protein [Legionella pneumophila subsp. pascullei]
MFGRLWLRAIGCPSTLDLSKMVLGRMPAQTTFESVKREFEQELRRVGLKRFQESIHAEKLILEQLLRQREEMTKKIDENCLRPALRRSANGYDVRGLYWNKIQEDLVKIQSKKERVELDEKIDWLFARRRFLKERNNLSMDKEPDYSVSPAL